MILTPFFGVDDLLFGMKQEDVIARKGVPSRQFKDEDGNVIFLYDNAKLRLSFYEEEDFRLGYIITAHPDVELAGVKPIGLTKEALLPTMREAGFAKWTTEAFDTYENFVNEEHWLVIQTEFGEVVKVEAGAAINEKTDEFDWKFQ